MQSTFPVPASTDSGVQPSTRTFASAPLSIRSRTQSTLPPEHAAMIGEVGASSVVTSLIFAPAEIIRRNAL